jgi:hypothetical protein
MDVEKFEKATRPLVTLILIITLCLNVSYLVWRFAGDLDPNSIIKDFVSIVLIVASFWFQQRQAEKSNEQMISQIKALGTGTGGTDQGKGGTS